MNSQSQELQDIFTIPVTSLTAVKTPVTSVSTTPNDTDVIIPELQSFVPDSTTPTSRSPDADFKQSVESADKCTDFELSYIRSENTTTRSRFFSSQSKQQDSKRGRRKTTKGDEASFTWMKKQFQQIAGPDGTLDKEMFKKALQVKESFFADRFFQLFDDDNSGTIDLGELLQGLDKLTKGTPTEKLQCLFNVYDVDANGTISRDELRTVLTSCMEESSLVFSDENLDDLTDALFDDADTDKSGEITFNKLKAQLEKHPGVLQNLTISAAKWLMPEKKKKTVTPRHLTWSYIRNNLTKVVFTIIFLLVHVCLYFLNARLYLSSNWFIICARGAGMCLNFDCAFIIVLVLRKSITFLRNTPLAKILPFDQHIMFHKLTGYSIVVFTVIHVAMHLGNVILYLSEKTELDLAEILFTLKANVGWFYGFAPLSGVLLLIILAIMFICSMEFVRRSGYFEVFYWTHKLYIPFFILNILHARNFWKWIVGPGIIFLVEYVYRLPCARKVRYGDMHIEAVNLLPSEVIQLIITRPNGFAFRPGDYVFLKIPVIAKYEWHPFTISSAPEMSDVFWVHILSAGHWTRSLYLYFEEQTKTVSHAEKGLDIGNGHSPRGSIQWSSIKNALFFKRRNTKTQQSYRKRIRHLKAHVPVHVDGPYGTPSTHIFQAEHAVLIGSGIGVTPFASILQSIMFRFAETETICPICAHKFCVDIPASVMKLRKVDFVWINRNQLQFEWFLSLLTRLESKQANSPSLGRVLDMHMYMTSAHTKADMKGIGLQMALDLIHESRQMDLITGLQTRTQPGRPDFDKLFTHISKNAKGKIKVFFCGSPMLGRSVKHYCQKYGFSFSQEKF